MKTTKYSAMFLLGLTALAVTAPAQDERVGPDISTPGAVQEIPGPSPTVLKLKQFNFEQRADFTLYVSTLSMQADAAYAALTANYNEMQVSPTRRAVMTALRTAQTDFNQKVAAVDDVAPETWETTKDNLISSWERLQEASKKARAQKT